MSIFTALTAVACLALSPASDRLPADLERDVHSKPDTVVRWLNLKPGDTVADIFGSGGYYSELLAPLVAPKGRILLINNAGFEAWGINILNDRFTNRDPGNIERILIDGINLELAPNSLDAALIVLAFHDLYVTPKQYNGEAYVPVGEPADIEFFLSQVLTALKPGGRFVIVDHVGKEDMDRETVFDLHRIPEDFAAREVVARGFEFVASDQALRNPDDDPTQIVFDPDIKGKTDRFILVFEKPTP